MQIEPATPDDLDTVVDQWIALAAGQQDYGSHIEADPNRDPMRVRLGNHIQNGTLYVARNPGVVGFVMFALEQGVFEEDVTRGRIHNVYVEPDERDTGVGSALLDAAEAALEENGAKTITLEALAANETAQQLYRKRGYRPHRVTYELALHDDPSLPT